MMVYDWVVDFLMEKTRMVWFEQMYGQGCFDHLRVEVIFLSCMILCNFSNHSWLTERCVSNFLSDFESISLASVTWVFGDRYNFYKISGIGCVLFDMQSDLGKGDEEIFLRCGFLWCWWITIITFQGGGCSNCHFCKNNWREEAWLNIKEDEISYYIFYQLMSIMCESLRHTAIVLIVVISDQGGVLALLCEILRRISWPQFAFEMWKWKEQPFVVIVIGWWTHDMLIE